MNIRISDLLDTLQPEDSPLEELSFAPTEEVKEAVFRRIHQEQGKKTRRRTWRRMPLAAAVLVSMAVLTAAGILFHAPVMEMAFGDTATEEYVTLLDASAQAEGWTLAVKECAGDDHTLLLGLELVAPEGTVLDAPSYLFGSCTIEFPALGKTYHGNPPSSYDDDPTDNRLLFGMSCVLPPQEGVELRGQKVKLTLSDLEGWAADTYHWERGLGKTAVWEIAFTADYPKTQTIRLEPDLPVHTLGVDASITEVEISTLRVNVTIQGDQLKGHHNWETTVQAPDGGSIPLHRDTCTMLQEVALYTRDGERLTCLYAITEDQFKTCSGGDDPSEPGALYLHRVIEGPGTEGVFLDLSTLDRIEVCGVSIPLNP